ncbi:MAG: BamA/TamA family outer membrane protein, partial [Bacteroidales bacterium]|nr:BamA/TamA family outer membrane protein [Bacteroidales bacterium]
FVPQRMHQAGIGFRFDSEEMASILLGVSLNKYKLFGSKLDTKLELGQNSNLTVSYGYTFRNLTRLNISAYGQHLTASFYDNFLNSKGEFTYNLNSEERYNLFRIKADYQVTGWRNSDLKFGILYDNYNCLVIDATPEGFNVGEAINSQEWQAYANWHFDNLDDSYYPRGGHQFNLLASATDQYGEFVYDARLDYKVAIPLGRKVTLIPQTWNRWIFGLPQRYYHNMVGGYVAGRYAPWHLPFVGINNAHWTSAKTDIARIDLNINLFGEHYLTLTGNYLAEWDFGGEPLTGNFGAGAMYSVNTVIGPIQFCTHWSTLSKKVGFYFSLGYEF